MQPAFATDRTRLRMERLRQLELEQLQWEQEALVMPEDLDRALFLSFESVKTEFSDLDGLSWPRYPVPLVTNPWATEEPTPKPTCTERNEFPIVPDSCDMRTPAHSPTLTLQPSPRRPKPRSGASSSRPETSSSPQDTIRVSRLPQSPWSSLQPANQFFLTQHTASPKEALAHCSESPYALPPANLGLACQGLRHPAYGQS